jgi:hypothetical protein
MSANLCDCERSHNGMGIAGRKCDCLAGSPVQYVWIEPQDTKLVADYWLTRRNADSAPGYDLGLPDLRVKYRWNGHNAWVTGEYQGRQRIEPVLSCLHGNNGWRIEGMAE